MRRLKHTFDESARVIADHYTLDIESVRNTYANRQETLQTYADGLTRARKGFATRVFGAVALGIVGIPLVPLTLGLSVLPMLWPIMSQIRRYEKMDKIGAAVKTDMGAPAPTPAV